MSRKRARMITRAPRRHQCWHRSSAIRSDVRIPCPSIFAFLEAEAFPKWLKADIIRGGQLLLQIKGKNKSIDQPRSLRFVQEQATPPSSRSTQLSGGPISRL